MIRSRVRLVAIAACALLLAGSVAFTTAGSACACSCTDGGTPEQSVSRASGVFVARATEKVSDGSSDIYQFAVSAVFKGDVGATTTVGTAASGAACGTSYEVGREYLLFVSRPREVNAAWEGYACGPRADKFDVRAVTERVYGPPAPPSDGAPVDQINWWTRLTGTVPAIGLLLAGVLTIGVVWMIVVLRGPRRRGWRQRP